MSLCGCGDDTPSSPPPAPTASSIPAAAAPVPATAASSAAPPTPDASVKPVYTLDSSDDCTVDRDEPCRRISIVVPKGQSRAQIASDLAHAAQEAQASYGSVRGIVFARAEGTDKNGAYSAGRAVWGTNEGTDRLYTADSPSVDYVDDYFKPEAPAPASLHRLPESRRKRIYFEVGKAGDRAQHEADAAYPTGGGDNAEQVDQEQRNITPNMKMNSDLTEKYSQAVRKRYRLTGKQFDDIQAEGLEKHWPTPDEAKD